MAGRVGRAAVYRWREQRGPRRADGIGEHAGGEAEAPPLNREMGILSPVISPNQGTLWSAVTARVSRGESISKKDHGPGIQG